MTDATNDTATSASPSAAAPSKEFASAEERNWAAGCHLAALVGFATGIGFVLGPLLVWLYKKDESAFVSDQGKEALNFQLTMLLAVIGACMLIIVLIGIPLLVFLAIFNFACLIIGAIKASEGVAYRYPFNLRLIK